MIEARPFDTPTLAVPPAGRLNAAGRARKHIVGVVAVTMIAILVLVALAAPVIAPHSPDAQDFAPLAGPSWENPLGTDRLGRDVLSRTIYGARVSLTVAVAAVALGTAVGLVLGVASGYISGVVDRTLQTMIDLMLAFPGIVALLAITAAVGPSLNLVTLSIGVLIAPIVTRVIRGAVLREKEAAYVEAARGLGAAGPRVVFRHIFPNVSSMAIVLATQLIPLAVLTEASLSFLGFGARPPTASWGGDLSGDAQLYFTLQPWMAVAPGVALTIAVLSFTFLGDWLRDVMDPRTRGGKA